MCWLLRSPVPVALDDQPYTGLMRHLIYVHLIWTTRDRAPIIDRFRARFLSRFLPAIAAQERAAVLALGMVTTHVHLLLRIIPATPISLMIQRMKGGSAQVAAKEGIGAIPLPLLWEEGYDLETVSPWQREQLGRYVLGQAEHHPAESITGWRAETRVRDDLPPRCIDSRRRRGRPGSERPESEGTFRLGSEDPSRPGSEDPSRPGPEDPSQRTDEP